MPRKLNRRRAIFGVLAVALIALAIPVSFALAGNGSVVKVPLLSNTENCGAGSDKKADGTVTMSRDKAGNLTVSVNIHGAAPSKDYQMWLYYNGPNCYVYYWDQIGKIKIDSSGNGRKTATFSGTNGYNDFWVYAYDYTNSRPDESPVVHLANG